MERIINDGSLGVVEKPKVKTQVELDLEKISKAHSADIIVMNSYRRASLENHEKLLGPNVIIVPGVVNIGIVKS